MDAGLRVVRRTTAPGLVVLSLDCYVDLGTAAVLAGALHDAVTARPAPKVLTGLTAGGARSRTCGARSRRRSAQSRRRRVHPGERPYAARYRLAKWPGWAKPQCIAIPVTVAVAGSAASRSRWAASSRTRRR